MWHTSRHSVQAHWLPTRPSTRATVVPRALAIAMHVDASPPDCTWSVVGALHSAVSCAAPHLLPAAAPHGIATTATCIASIVRVSAEPIRSDVCNAKCTTVDGDADGGHASRGSAASITAAPPVSNSCGFRESAVGGGCRLWHPCPGVDRATRIVQHPTDRRASLTGESGCR